MQKSMTWLASLAVMALAAACDEPFLGTLPVVKPATQATCGPETPPSNLQAQLSGSVVHLTWDCTASDVEQFVLDRKVDTLWEEYLTSIDAAARSASDTDVRADGGYQYRLRGIADDCSSEPTNTVTVYTVPAAPDFTLALPISTTEIQLHWSSGALHVDHLELTRSTGSAAEVVVDATLGPGANAYDDSNLDPDTEYTYRLVAVTPPGATGALVSAPDVAAAWTLPLAADSLTVTHASSLTFDLSWSDANQHTVSATIHRAVGSAATYDALLEISAGVNHYLDAAVQQGQGYRYMVVLNNQGGRSTAAGPVTIYTAPFALQQFAVSLVSPTIAHLSWIAGVGVIDHLELWRSAGATPAELVGGLLAAGATAIVDPGLALDTFYRYELRAWSPAGDAVALASSPATDDLWTQPKPAAGFAANMISSTSIELTWADSNLSTTAAHLSRKRQSDVSFVPLTTLASGTFRHLDGGLTAGTGYVYRLQLAGPGGLSTMVEAAGSTSGQPVPSWLGAPSIDATCTLTIPGQASVDTGAGVTYSSASGSIEHVAGAVAASEDGIEGTLTDLTLGSIATAWTVVDSRGGHGTIARTLYVKMADAATMTALAPPTATSNGDNGTGRQVMLPALEVDSGTGCHGCDGLRGALALADGTGCVLDRDGGVRCWGDGYYGQLGTGVQNHAWTDWPLQVCESGQDDSCPPLRNVVSVVGGSGHLCALLDDGTVRCWGFNGFGPVGDGTTNNRELPTPVCASGSGTNCPKLRNVVALSLGSAFSCALIDNGTVYCWGSNDLGQLGDSSTTGHYTPALVCNGGSGASCGGAPLSDVVAIAAQAVSTCALTSNGQVLCWGSDNAGQLGDGDLDRVPRNSTLPQPVCESGSRSGGDCAPLDHVVALSSRAAAVCAIRDDGANRYDGELWCWGDNFSEELGDGLDGNASSETARHVPLPVCGNGSHSHLDCEPLTGVRAVALAGDSSGTSHSCALLADGGVRCWGSNANFKLGIDSTVASVAQPGAVRVMSNLGSCSGTEGFLDGAVAVTVSIAQSCALLASGEVYCWGVTSNAPPSAETSCAAVPVCASGDGVACPTFDQSAVRACGSVTIDLQP